MQASEWSDCVESSVRLKAASGLRRGCECVLVVVQCRAAAADAGPAVHDWPLCTCDDAVCHTCLLACPVAVLVRPLRYAHCCAALCWVQYMLIPQLTCALICALLYGVYGGELLIRAGCCSLSGLLLGFITALHTEASFLRRPSAKSPKNANTGQRLKASAAQ